MLCGRDKAKFGRYARVMALFVWSQGIKLDQLSPFTTIPEYPNHEFD